MNSQQGLLPQAGSHIGLRQIALRHGTFRTCSRKARLKSLKGRAVTKEELHEVEMHIAIVNQQMNTAAKEDRFKDAAEYRSRLEALRLKQRCLQVEHNEVMRFGIPARSSYTFLLRNFSFPLMKFSKDKLFNIGALHTVESFLACIRLARSASPVCCNRRSVQAEENWIQTMGVDRLPHGRHQPFYQVLVDERYRPGSMITYVAQENITIPEAGLEEELPIRHSLGGPSYDSYNQTHFRFATADITKLVSEMFTTFDKHSKRYKPTQHLISQYPDSMEAREIGDDL